jgi:hypothetical protein
MFASRSAPDSVKTSVGRPYELVPPSNIKGGYYAFLNPTANTLLRINDMNAPPRTALVIGASRNVGYHTALRLLGMSAANSKDEFWLTSAW